MRVFEDENEEAACAEDQPIEVEDLFFLVVDGLAVDERVVGCVFFQDLDVALLHLCVIRNKGVVRLYPQRSQDHVRLWVALFIADVQFFAGVLDPEAELLVLGKVGEVGQVFVDPVDGGRDGEGVVEGDVALLFEGGHFVGEIGKDLLLILLLLVVLGIDCEVDHLPGLVEVGDHLLVDCYFVGLGLLQHLLQHLVLLPQNADQLVHVGLVDDRLVLDLLGPARVSQRREGLFEVVVGRGDRADHGRAGVSSQGVSQDEGQLGVAIGHELLVLLLLVAVFSQDLDDSSQSSQRLVDFGGFPEPVLGIHSCLGDALAAGQVDQMDHAVLDTGLPTS